MKTFRPRKSPFVVGDRIQKFKFPIPFTVKNVESDIYTVTRISKSDTADSGWEVDVVIDPCPCCGKGVSSFYGYTTTWFTKAKNV